MENSTKWSEPLCTVRTLVLKRGAGGAQYLIETSETVLVATAVKFEIFLGIFKHLTISTWFLISEFNFSSTKSCDSDFSSVPIAHIDGGLSDSDHSLCSDGNLVG